jgi:capsule polysaccharide export protein KpsE/RkpR
MTLSTLAWVTVLLIAVVAYALLTAQDYRGGDE